MNNSVYYQIWIFIKWFFSDFCIQALSVPLGPLKDILDVLQISWQLVCLGISLLGIAIGFIIKYIKSRM